VWCFGRVVFDVGLWFYVDCWLVRFVVGGDDL